jgi:acyl-CoA thioesterase-1
MKKFNLRKYQIIILLPLLLVYSLWINMKNNKTIRYVALGDSYTICEGATWEQSWPFILANNLKKQGINIELIANPSKTGWTTQNLIDNELPVFDNSQPTFSTLLIGVNDWVQEVSKENFHKNLNTIINHVQRKAGNKLILITIPDFSVTPEGPKYSKGRNISEGLQGFNQIIKEEAKKRKLPCVDIFPTSLNMLNNPELISSDNLHPSAKEYALWEQLIYPAAYELLK